MERSNKRFFSSAVALSLTSATGCISASDIAELGVYKPESPPEEAGQILSADDDDAGAADTDYTGPTSGAAGGPPCRTSGCISTQTIDYADSNMLCIPILAHAESSDDAPYPVPIAADHYVKFTGRIDGKARFIRAFSAVVDEAIALHHMRLYVHYGVVPEGTVVGQATESGLQLLYSWAPGVGQLFLDESVAIPIDQDMFYTLEVHYNFPGQPIAPVSSLNDSSGLRVCFTSAQPKYPVSFTRLGAVDIASPSATGMCTSRFFGPIELLAMRPHMNALGRNAKLSVRHGQSAEELVYDAPFDFNADGITVIGPLTVSPGDTLTSRCDYAESARSGTGVDDEVCELYVLHWPAHSLVSNSRPGVPDACID